MSEMTSLPIDRTSRAGDTAQPDTAVVSTKRDTPRRKQRQPDAQSSDDPDAGGRLLDIEA